MTNKPKVVVSRTRPVVEKRDFRFTRSDLPLWSKGLSAYRQAAWEAFQSLSLPSITEEAWRRTDLRDLPLEKFRLPGETELEHLSPVPEKLLHPPTDERHGGQVILFPGGARTELEADLARRGVIFTDLQTAERDHPALIASLAGSLVRAEESKFAALAAALAANGILLYIPKGVHLERPLHSLLWGPGDGLAHLSHLLVWVDEEASVTYVHEAASPTTEDGDLLHAGLVEICLGAGAHLTFVELQSWGRNVWNFSHGRASVESQAGLDWVFGAVGSRLTKSFSSLDLVGEGATARMSGFYFADDRQHLDHDTRQNHLAPRTTSDLLFKGALTGAARSVWRGMIYVAPGAQGTNGYQANRNLILSPRARADSLPGLEILANDVRCTHGATVGRLEEEPLFYLQSRGLARSEAERLMVEGFFDPILQRIPLEGVRRRFQEAIAEKMDAHHQLASSLESSTSGDRWP